MARILITGVAGFLGSHLADAFLADGHHVAGNDNMLGGHYDNVPDKVHMHFYRDDCCDQANMADIMKREKIDTVYHCAASAYEGLSVFSPAIVTKNIVQAAVGVFSAACATKVKRIVMCSSMARYGSIHPPFSEQMPPKPQDPYGIGKVCAEQLLKNLCETHGVEYVIAVPHNIIGPRQKYDDPFRNVASIMINLMLQGRAPTIYGDGLQQRCFSYIDDCLFCLKEMAFNKKVVGHTINIGPDEEPITIRELYWHIARLLCFTGIPTYMPDRPSEVKVALCSSDKARDMLGYETKTPLVEGLEKMIAFIRERGPKPFRYHVPIEIRSEKTPKTWTDRLF